MIWEAWQWRAIRGAEDKAYEADSRARELAIDLRFLQDAVERLVLLNRAMWEMLGERAGVTEAQLADKMREIDLRDGKADGKLRQEARTCPACGRTLGKRREVCLYCGVTDSTPAPFRAT